MASFQRRTSQHQLGLHSAGSSREDKENLINPPAFLDKTINDGGAAFSSSPVKSQGGAGGGGGSSDSSEGCYNARYFMSITNEGGEFPRPLPLNSERDLGKLFSKLVDSLHNTDDWNFRLKSLITLQSVIMTTEFDREKLIVQFRAYQDIIGAQVCDLRSTVVKEACKCIALLSAQCGNLISPMVDVWIPLLMKQIVLKIQVMNQAADKTIRAIISSNVTGFPRMLPVIIDGCKNKSNLLRAYCVDYLVMICCTWKVEIIEKYIAGFKEIIKTCVVDADQNTRKWARFLYMVLRRHKSLQAIMEQFISLIDASAAKLILSETKTMPPALQEIFAFQNQCIANYNVQAIAKMYLMNPNSVIESSQMLPSNGGNNGMFDEDDADNLPSRPPPPPPPLQLTKSHAGTAFNSAKSLGDNATSKAIFNPRVASRSLAIASTIVDVEEMYSSASNDTIDDMDESLFSEDIPSVGNKRNLAGATTSSSTSSSRRLSMMPARGTAVTADSGLGLGVSVGLGMGLHSTVGTGIIGGGGARRQSMAPHQFPIYSDESSLNSNNNNSNSSYSSSNISGSLANSSNDSYKATIAPHTSTPRLLGGASRIGSGPVRISATISKVAPVAQPAPTAIVVTNAISQLNIQKQQPNTENEKLMKTSTLAMKAIPSNFHKQSNENEKQTIKPPRESSVVRTQAPVAVAVAAKMIDVQQSVASMREVPAVKLPSSSSSASQQSGISLDSIKKLSQDAQWSNRVKAFDHLSTRLKKAVANKEEISSSSVEQMIDICIVSANDSNLKVMSESLECMKLLLQHYQGQCLSKLSGIIVTLFQKLADQHGIIKNTSNSLLELVRLSFEPTTILCAISPKMLEIPAIVRTAVMQFLVFTVPSCENYFHQPQSVAAFLGRMGIVLNGSGNAKPPVALVNSGRKVLELVYKFAPELVCRQIANLPLQQQETIKKILSASIRDIDRLVVQASKQDRLDYDVDAKSYAAPASSSTTSRTVATSSIVSTNSTDDIDIACDDDDNDDDEFDSSIIESMEVRENTYSEAEASVVDDNDAFRNHEDDLEGSITDDSELTINDDDHNESSLMETNDLLVDNTHYNEEFDIKNIDNDHHNSDSGGGGVGDDEIDINWLLHVFKSKLSISEQSDALNVLVSIFESGSHNWDSFFPDILMALCELLVIPSHHRNQSDLSGNRKLTGLSPLSTENGDTRRYESMHVSCSALLLFINHRPDFLLNCLDMIVRTICESISYIPVALALICEKILTELSNHFPLRCTDLLLSQLKNNEVSIHLRLMALRVLTTSIMNLSERESLDSYSTLLPNIAGLILSFLSDNSMEIRKAAILVLVEIHRICGDDFFEFIKEINSLQLKLLLIYIEKRKAE